MYEFSCLCHVHMNKSFVQVKQDPDLRRRLQVQAAGRRTAKGLTLTLRAFSPFCCHVVLILWSKCAWQRPMLSKCVCFPPYIYLSQTHTLSLVNSKTPVACHHCCNMPVHHFYARRCTRHSILRLPLFYNCIRARQNVFLTCTLHAPCKT
jgi:hypothetical protein